MIKVLLIEDSQINKLFIASALARNSEIQVVGEVTNGTAALEMVKNKIPNLIILGLNLPNQSAITAIKEIMKHRPTPIIGIQKMSGNSSAKIAMKAINAGVLDVFEEPILEFMEDWSDRLVKKILEITSVVVKSGINLLAPPANFGVGNKQNIDFTDIKKHGLFKIVGIASSTGGPRALASLMVEMPADFSAPILIVQHMARGYIEGLAEWLEQVSPLKVEIAQSGGFPQPGHVYLAPDNRHLEVNSSGNMVLTDTPPVNGFKPSGNPLLLSLANYFGPKAVGVILTGMGDDGVKGLKSLKQAGGYTIAQDEQSSVIFGMPGQAIKAGVVEKVVALEYIATHLTKMVRG